MNRYSALVLLTLVGMTTSAAADAVTSGAELIVNGGFEGNTPPPPYVWGYLAPAGWTEEAGFEMGGGEVYMAPAYATPYAGTFDYQMYTQNLPGVTRLSAWQEHTYADGFASNVSSLVFDGWANRPAGGAGTTANATITTGNMTSNVFTPHETLTLGTTNADWTELTGSVAVHHGGGTDETNYVKLTIAIDGANMVGNFDAFSIVPVPEPGTLAMAFAGLIGMLAYAWRKRR